jgi:ABC-2 type transport system ATP-binding protein
MRQKLGFCMAILHEPDLLALDEPSTGVDPVSRVELWALIADAATRGAAVVMATTYLDEAERAHQVLVLDEGDPILQGAPAEVLARAPGTVTRVTTSTATATSWRRGRERHEWHPGGPLPGDDVVELDMEDAVVAAAMNERRPGAETSLFTVPPAQRRSPLAVARRLTKRFGQLRALDDTTLSVDAGEIVGVIGANGAGKTTLIRVLLGLVVPDEGDVRLFGESPSRRTRRDVGYVSQDLGLYRDLTVAENLSFVGAAFGIGTPSLGALEPVARTLAGRIGLGRQRQLAFACALSHRPSLLVLDEPTSGVDPISRARLWDVIHAQAEAGAGLLVSTHYMQEAEQCDRLVLMDAGRVVAEGTASDIIGDTTATRVRAGDWASAFGALRAAGFAVSLAGRGVRVVDASPAEVLEATHRAGLSAEVDSVPATLEEKMVAVTRERTAAGAGAT